MQAAYLGLKGLGGREPRSWPSQVHDNYSFTTWVPAGQGERLSRDTGPENQDPRGTLPLTLLSLPGPPLLSL